MSMIITDLPYDDYIDDKVQEICKSIAKEGYQSNFKDIFMVIHEYIEENITKFLPEPRDYDIND